MDWGLFEIQRTSNGNETGSGSGTNDGDSNSNSNDSREYPFLREEIVYSSPYYYYFAIIGDLILRFGWTMSVSLIEIGLIQDDIMMSILAPLEIFR